MRKIHDLTGGKYGRLTVLGIADRRKDGLYRYRCLCECGIETVVIGRNLKNGHSKSCGCLHRDIITTHGKTNSRLFGIWHSILQRCRNQNDKDYKNYGERGIEVCDEWKSNFQSFYDWAMANGYADNLTIDRKDVNGNYCPENCRWATQKEQSNNKRSNRCISYNDRTMTLQQWAEEIGISPDALYRRIEIYGWSVEKAFNKPLQVHKKQ